MQITLPVDLEVQLNDFAARTGREPAEVVQQAVAQLLARNEEFRKQVQLGFDQFERGEFVEEEMDALIQQMTEY